MTTASSRWALNAVGSVHWFTDPTGRPRLLTASLEAAAACGDDLASPRR